MRFSRTTHFMVASVLFLCLVMGIGCFRSANADEATTKELDSVVLYIGWRAEPTFGGFFQAVADGTYEKYGLDVQINLGGPGSNPAQILLAKRADFVTGSSQSALNALSEGGTLVTIAAFFQKAPRALIAHPGSNIRTINDIKGHHILIGALGKVTFWPWLKLRYGFEDKQVEPFHYSLAPFLMDDSLVMQGYVTHEPYALRKAGIKQPKVFLLADYGWAAYATTLATLRGTIENRGDYVQRFVKASKRGWFNYLNDPSLGNALIKKNNPDITAESMEYAVKTIRQLGLVTGGDAKTKGIGAMTDERWATFYENMVETGVQPAGMNINNAYTLEFVNNGPVVNKTESP